MREGDKTPLEERFEAASKEFRATYARKSRNARTGVRPYRGAEFLEDVYAAASAHGLFPKPCGPTSGCFTALRTKSMAASLANVPVRTTA